MLFIEMDFCLRRNDNLQVLFNLHYLPIKTILKFFVLLWGDGLHWVGNAKPLQYGFGVAKPITPSYFLISNRVC